MGNILTFPRTPEPPEHRRGVDRRSSPRGGRRSTDKAGYAPLVLLIDGDVDASLRCEAILAKLHFAVAPARTVEEAARIMAALHPNVIVARIADAAALRQAAPADTPLVLLGTDLLDPEALVEEIRRELRRRNARRS